MDVAFPFKGFKAFKTYSLISVNSNPFLLLTQAFLLHQKSIFLKQRPQAQEDLHCEEVNQHLCECYFPSSKIPSLTFVYQVWYSLGTKRHLWHIPWATQSCFIHLSKYIRKSDLLLWFSFYRHDASHWTQRLYTLPSGLVLSLIARCKLSSKTLSVFLADRGRGFPKYCLNYLDISYN